MSYLAHNALAENQSHPVPYFSTLAELEAQHRAAVQVQAEAHRAAERARAHRVAGWSDVNGGRKRVIPAAE